MFPINLKRLFPDVGRKLSQKASKKVEHSPLVQSKVIRMPASTTIIKKYDDVIKTLHPHKKYIVYPGAGIRKDIVLPRTLLNAALVLFEKYPVGDVAAEARKMRKHLWGKHPPVEPDQLNKIGTELEHQLTSIRLQQTGYDEQLDEEELEKQMVSIRKDALKVMKRSIYNWKPMYMDAFQSVVYMSSNLLSNYAIWYSIMSEIAALDPDFKPRAVLDFGSGLATSVWAVNEIWTSVEQHYCWDHCVDVCTLARLLLQEGKVNDDMIYSGVYFRQQLDKHYTKQESGFDMVLSGHTLLDLPSKEARLKIIDKLWTQTGRYLILAENGTTQGHKLIEEARLHILNTYKESTHHSGHVFAPCPHEKPCPLTSIKSRPCNFEVKYKSGSLRTKQNLFLEMEPSKNTSSKKTKVTNTRYCYVVLKKGEPAEDIRPPRVIGPPSEYNSCTQCQMCFPDGIARRVYFHKKTVGGNVSRLAKRCVWGTRLPVTGWHDGELDIKDSSDRVHADMESSDNVHADMESSDNVHTDMNNIQAANTEHIDAEYSET